jgi:hypothetical protein
MSILCITYWGTYNREVVGEWPAKQDGHERKWLTMAILFIFSEGCIKYVTSTCPADIRMLQLARVADRKKNPTPSSFNTVSFTGNMKLFPKNDKKRKSFRSCEWNVVLITSVCTLYCPRAWRTSLLDRMQWMNAGYGFQISIPWVTFQNVW